MDWERYRARCDAGDAFSRWMLEQTVEVLERDGETALGARLRAELEAPPVPKPPDHAGGRETDFLELRLTLAEACAVHRVVAAAVARGERTRGTARRGLGGFEEAWREHLDWLTGAHPRSPHRGN